MQYAYLPVCAPNHLWSLPKLVIALHTVLNNRMYCIALRFRYSYYQKLACGIGSKLLKGASVQFQHGTFMER